MSPVLGPNRKCTGSRERCRGPLSSCHYAFFRSSLGAPHSPCCPVLPHRPHPHALLYTLRAFSFASTAPTTSLPWSKPSPPSAPATPSGISPNPSAWPSVQADPPCPLAALPPLPSEASSRPPVLPPQPGPAACCPSPSSRSVAAWCVPSAQEAHLGCPSATEPGGAEVPCPSAGAGFLEEALQRHGGL